MNKKLSLLIITLLLTIFATPAYAINAEHASETATMGTPDPMQKAVENAGGDKNLNSERMAELKEKLSQEREQIAEKIRSRIGERCKQIEAKIQNRLGRFNEHKEDHLGKYNRLKERLSHVIGKLQEKEIDTATLEEDLATLDEKIQNFSTDYTTFIDLLEKTQNHACGESEGAFVESLKTSRQQLGVVKEDVADIKDFYQNTIKQDISNIRSNL